MAGNDRDTIYIDIDDEITGIIDKLQASKNKVVALVLPKRAAVFQSIVNMKLLKRAADSAGKNLVLITTEAGLLPLAGMAGIHVAKTLNSTPEVPKAPNVAEDVEEAVNESAAAGVGAAAGAAAGVTAATAGDKTVGELAGRPPADDAMETLTLDADKLPSESTAKAPKPKTFEPPAKSKAKKNKKLKIPNFNRFRVLVACGILLLILLIAAGVMAAKVLPKATITLHTTAQKIDSNLTLNLSTSAQSLDPSSFTIPAKQVQEQKTYSQSVATTGQTNNGNKASGSVIMTATEQGTTVPPDVPAGTGLSSNGQTYITQSNTTFDIHHGNNNGDGTITYEAAGATNIIAQNGGASYNGATSFSVAGRSDVSAKVVDKISGGTDKIVKTVNQNDISSAKSKINANDPAIKQALADQLKGDGYFAINATYNATTPNTTTSANVGDVADNVTVTESVTYTMYGVHKSDLKTLVDNDVSSQIDTSKQKVQDEGLDNATFTVANSTSVGPQVVMDTKAIAGPDINVNSVKQSSEGLKSGQVQSNLENNPNIKSVDVNLSPFWVTSVPSNPSKIKVIIAEPKTVSNSNANSQ